MGALKERRLTSFQTSLKTIYNYLWLAALYSHAPTKQLNLNNVTNHINNTCTCIGSNNLTFMFSKTKIFYCFSFNKRSPKDAPKKTEFFAFVISPTQRSNQ